ncbi:hypothetical protein CEXT_78951 [Caerostris extrusa]|uniref:Uncharacterized protein n=1 Tax=Caerostris extrusa TaxID=172846 RepID=A0AAV4PPN5_CAEEX|nr:hypothetical protein CEXT_78951 [Caerostris extrusa]
MFSGKTFPDFEKHRESTASSAVCVLLSLCLVESEESKNLYCNLGLSLILGITELPAFPYRISSYIHVYNTEFSLFQNRRFLGNRLISAASQLSVSLGRACVICCDTLSPLFGLHWVQIRAGRDGATTRAVLCGFKVASQTDIPLFSPLPTLTV